MDAEKFLTEAELRCLFRTSDQEKTNALAAGRSVAVKEWFLIYLAAHTGLRVQEIADLSCGDFSLNGMYVLVRHGKNNKARVVHVNEDFNQHTQHFLAWKRDQGDDVSEHAPVFSVKGRRMTTRALQKAYHRVIQKAGIVRPKGYGIHSLRHTYACFLLKASKFNLRLVQKQLGHASTRTTEIYADIFSTDMQRAVARLYH